MDCYHFYTTNELKPKGWLRRQLEIQANGLSGNLDKVWPDIRDSSWIGGNRDGWERVPYWLDGFIPLAYLLENEDLKARAQRYIEAIIKNQRPDGWICPCEEKDIPGYDTWAVLLLSKVLTVYYECSKDERIPDVLYRTMKNYYDLLSSEKIKLFNWGKARWFEGFIALNFLSERYSDSWINELAVILKSQGTDYNMLVDRWKKPLNVWTYETHIVNLGMMLKAEAVSFRLTGSEYGNDAKKLYDILYKYNGTPVGIFTGDECLSGLSPIQGTELCSVAELMYSMELLYAFTGDSSWAEKLETIAFNAFPATNSDDMWTHQYNQESNQINCIRMDGRPLFRTNCGSSHLFGLEPNYGCCTANFNQAWPKFALSAFMKRENEIINSVMLPSKLAVDGIKITLDTDYPFVNSASYTIEAEKEFTFSIRIPSFAKKLSVNGKRVAKTDMLSFSIAPGTTGINVSFSAEPEVMSRPHGLSSVKCGSLVFSLPIKFDTKMYEYTSNGVERKFPYCDYELIGKSEWRYCLSDDQFEIVHHRIPDVPFSSEKPAVTLKAKVRRIDWDYEDGFDTVCAKKPENPVPFGKEKTVDLYPYGCAKLRVTELPLIK